MNLPKQPDCSNCQCLAHSVFNCLNEDELAILNQSKSVRRIRKGQILFFEGDLSKGLHCISSGKVKVYKTLEDGTTQILRISGVNEIVGYRGLLGDGRYIATAETIEESDICFIPRETILHMLSCNQQFSLRLLSKFATDLSEAEEKSIRYLHKSTRERLADALLMLEKNFGKDFKGFIGISLTRQELAALTGQATETIIRSLHQLEEEGVIELDKKLIRIVDHTRLTNISNNTDN